MRAAVLRAYHAPLEVVDRPDPSPGPGEVVLDVAACGVCGSDHFLQAGGFDSTLPIVPGHEAAGTVVATGDGVDGLPAGTHAAIYYLQHCGTCRWCRDGRPNLCRTVARMGVDVDGAFATRVTVPARCVLPVDDDLDLAAVAVLTDAVGTGYHALTRVARVRPGERVAVLGIGGIGSNVVQLAAHLGAHVTAVARRPAALDLARRLGADEVLRSSPALHDELQEVTGGDGPDVVVQTAGSAAADRQAVEAVAPGGRVVLVGASAEAFELRATELIWREATLLGSRGFTPQDIRDVIDLYRRGAVTVDHLLTRRRPLEEVNEALADLQRGEVLRTIIEPKERA